MNSLPDILKEFEGISLMEMDSVKLLNRTDTKFLLHNSILNKVLWDNKNEYRILEIQQKRTARYETLYYDQPNFKYYLDHHNKRTNRYKVRKRTYLDSGLCFLEVKHKFKGRTDKNRIKIGGISEMISGQELSFLEKNVPKSHKLKASIWNNFERITLVHQERKERITLDLGLNFRWEDRTFGYPNCVIAEVKQESVDRSTPIIESLKKNEVRQIRISKYCIGMGMLYEELKTNNFKRKFITLNKTENA